MSILTAASSSSVMNGYDYYKRGRVLSYEKIDDYEYEGYVRGNQKEPYHVVINVNHPRKSYCSCPYASSSDVVCKHMVSLYFAIFKDEADDYESWLSSDFLDEDRFDEDEYEEWDNEDEDDYYTRHNTNPFVLPFCYDEILDEYVNDFSYEELKEKLKKELNMDKEDTFKRFLKEKYEIYMEKQDEEYSFIEKLNQKFIKASNIYDYDYNDYRTTILEKSDKTKISKIYSNNKYKQLLEDTLLNPSLAVYFDYKWIAQFIKNKLDDNKKKKLINDLNNYLNSLKHYSIKNTLPKSNILICIYELSNYSNAELAKSILKNSKYEEYVSHVINNVYDVDEFYDCLINEIEKYKGFDKSNIPNVLLLFHNRFENETNKIERMLIDESYYDFMFNYREDSLRYLLILHPEILTKIEKNARKIEHLLPLYSLTEQTDKLYNLIKQQNKEYYLNKYIDVLKDKYNDELYEHYRSKIYEELSLGKGREIYSEVAQNFVYINKLNNGKDLINDLIKQLKESPYQNRPALFDEINIVVSRIKNIKN